MISRTKNELSTVQYIATTHTRPTTRCDRSPFVDRRRFTAPSARARDAPVKGPELTRRLIDEGARGLAEHGPAGLSLRRLAAACGTSTMAVYTRFGDKEGLLRAMRREGFRRLGEQLAQAGTDPGATLLDLGRAYRRAALESPHLYTLMFGPGVPGLGRDADDDAAADATYAPLVAGVRSAVADGSLVGDPERVALHLWAVAHGMVSLELSSSPPFEASRAAHAYDEALGLGAQPFLPPAVTDE